jgi:hypothetical protein
VNATQLSNVSAQPPPMPQSQCRDAVQHRDAA